MDLKISFHNIMKNSDYTPESYLSSSNITYDNLLTKNILLAVKDFKKYYQKEINTINGNEYVVLGFDFIVDNEKNVQIIEINHRSNYGTLILDCVVSFFKDMILLLANNSKSRDLILI